MKIAEKLRSKKGVTIAEMLLALLILAMTMSILGGGLYVVQNAYQKIIREADAQTLLSTASSAVSAELQKSKDIRKETVAGAERWSFYQVDRGYRIALVNRDSNIYLETENGKQISLLSEQVIPKGLNLEIEGLTYGDEVWSFRLKVFSNEREYENQLMYVRPLNVQS